MPTSEVPHPCYAVRRLRPEDAPGVVECIRRVYGDSYVHPEVYDPGRILKLNESGELVSVVSLDGKGSVVGHYALERPGLGQIAEEGEALVLPEHRHQHLMEAMRELLETEARRLGLTGLFGQAVTNHLFTQKVHERYALWPCALSLGASPRSFHNMPEPLPQRMSLLVAFKYLQPPARIVSHVPAHHQAICARIYDQFQVPVDFCPKAPPWQGGESQGQITVALDTRQQEAMIRVQRIGADTAAAVSHARQEACAKAQVEAVFLELPLAQPGTPDLCRSAEQDGFFFSGIGPRFAADGDALRLQWLNVDLDIALLQIENPFAKELVAYVGRERERVGKGR